MLYFLGYCHSLMVDNLLHSLFQLQRKNSVASHFRRVVTLLFFQLFFSQYHWHHHHYHPNAN